MGIWWVSQGKTDNVLRLPNGTGYTHSVERFIGWVTPADPVVWRAAILSHFGRCNDRPLNGWAAETVLVDGIVQSGDRIGLEVVVQADGLTWNTFHSGGSTRFVMDPKPFRPADLTPLFG